MRRIQHRNEQETFMSNARRSLVHAGLGQAAFLPSIALASPRRWPAAQIEFMVIRDMADTVPGASSPLVFGPDGNLYGVLDDIGRRHDGVARAVHNEDLTHAFSRCPPFIMDKFVLRQQVLERLADDLLQAEHAVRVAHEAATHEENIAENKYDTLGLEAAYLATGQARRVELIRQAMANWRRFRPNPYDDSKGIQLGALVCVVDSDDKQQQLFLGPDGGSMKLVSGTQLVQVISCDAPLGRAVLGKHVGDELSIQIAEIRQKFEVLRID